MHTGQSIRVHTQLQNAYGDGLDLTLLWKPTLPALNPGTRHQHIVFKDMTYILSNWTSDEFPNVIYITCDEVTNGLRNDQLEPTNRVAAL